MAENATSTKQQEVIKEKKIVLKSGKKQPNEASLNMAEIRELAELRFEHCAVDSLKIECLHTNHPRKRYLLFLFLQKRYLMYLFYPQDNDFALTKE